jgi:phenylpropionate dioxygenase-like ring-hydroxylating dioxygenase large terminal subunit
MEALRNTWYAAAWSEEITDKLFKRVILEQPIVFYRRLGGEPVALGNVCPHRFAPLNLGKIVNGNIQCPYHGLQFNSAGKCVFNPDGDGLTPDSVRARSYPVLERFGMIWVWMGEAARADAALLPEFPFLESPKFRAVKGYSRMSVNYRYMLDNLVDVAHLLTVHNETLYCEGLSRSKTVVEREGTGIWAKRVATNTAPPPIFDMLWRRGRGDYQGTMDHWAESRWDAPSLISQSTGITMTGNPREEGLETKNIHFATPESFGNTHYFWAICRDFDLDNDQLDKEVYAGTEFAVIQQDGILLTALQETMGDREFWSMKPALLQGDVGAVQIRRALDRLMAAEGAETASQPQAVSNTAQIA